MVPVDLDAVEAAPELVFHVGKEMFRMVMADDCKRLKNHFVPARNIVSKIPILAARERIIFSKAADLFDDIAPHSEVVGTVDIDRAFDIAVTPRDFQSDESRQKAFWIQGFIRPAHRADPAIGKRFENTFDPILFRNTVTVGKNADVGGCITPRRVARRSRPFIGLI